jgi:hypothetical protein
MYYFFMIKISKQLIFIIILITISGCVHDRPFCISKQSETLEISWGERYTLSGAVNGYMMNGKSELYNINKPSEFDNFKKIMIKKIDEDYFCTKIKLVNNVIMKNQALSIPADTVRFIQYENPGANVLIIAEWNPKYKISANKDFIILYDSLQTLVR